MRNESHTRGRGPKTNSDLPQFTRSGEYDIQMLPTYRPDKGMAVESAEAFNAWVDKLAEAADVDIRDFTSYLGAFRVRHAFFHDMGCRLSDMVILIFLLPIKYLQNLIPQNTPKI